MSQCSNYTKQTERLRCLFVSVCFVISVFFLPARSNEYIRFEDSRVSMACNYSIVAYAADTYPIRQTVNEAFDEIDRIDRLMSHYRPDSPLSQLNRTAAQQAVRVNDELFGFIAECVRYSRLSDGAFDITVGPLMRAWGFFRGAGRRPTAAELQKARANLGYQHIILDEKARTIRFARPGLELDLGGIAKGYALDRAVAVLKQRGIRDALVNACGSTIYGLGSDPILGIGQGWAVKLRDPLDERRTAQTVHLKNQALSVSGSYEKFFELKGRRYSHIMDPRTGRPVPGVLSVAVITDNGTTGDALDNVFYVQGVRWSRQQWRTLTARQVMFFLPQSARGWRVLQL